MKIFVIIIVLASMLIAGCSHALVGKAQLEKSGPMSERNEVLTPRMRTVIRVQRGERSRADEEPDQSPEQEKSETSTYRIKRIDGRLVVEKLGD